MFNKIFKTIHSRYSKFFDFIFFLRYLITIFFISILTFLIIPNYFDYEKRAEILKNHLLQKYSIEISEYEKIKFHSLPVPMLEFYNSTLNFKSASASVKVKNIKIYPKLLTHFSDKINFSSFNDPKLNYDLVLDKSELGVSKTIIAENPIMISLDFTELKKHNTKKVLVMIKVVDSKSEAHITVAGKFNLK